MGTEYGMFAGEEKVTQGFGEETWIADVEDLDEDGRISTWLKQMGQEGVDRIHLGLDRGMTGCWDLSCYKPTAVVPCEKGLG